MTGTKFVRFFALALVFGIFAACEEPFDISVASEEPTTEGMVLVQLKGKTFEMGSGKSDEKKHNVSFTHDLLICDHEVTQKEWMNIFDSNPSHFNGDVDTPPVDEVQENRPVEKVNWYAAIAYCNKLSLKEKLPPCYSVKDTNGDEINWAILKFSDIPTIKSDEWNAVICDWDANGYRLPTEAEWEICARGGLTGDVWAGTNDSNELGNYAWYNDNIVVETHEVKKKLPNAYGLYDMSGNVAEWCWDWYSSYGDDTAENPKGPDSYTTYRRINRGGSYFAVAANCRVAYRGEQVASEAGRKTIGFRIVRTVP